MLRIFHLSGPLFPRARRQTNNIPYDAWCVRVTDGVWHARSLSLSSPRFQDNEVSAHSARSHESRNAMAAGNASCLLVNWIGQDGKTARACACAEPCLQAGTPPARAKTLCRSRSLSWEGPLFQYQHRSLVAVVVSWRGVACSPPGLRFLGFSAAN